MKKRHSTEQIVAKLRQADVELGKSLKVPEVCKQLGISESAAADITAGVRSTAGWTLRWPSR